MPSGRIDHRSSVGRETRVTELRQIKRQPLEIGRCALLAAPPKHSRRQSQTASDQEQNANHPKPGMCDERLSQGGSGQGCLEAIQIDRCDETVPSPRHGLYEPWVVRVVPENAPDLLHSSVQGMVEIYKRVHGPYRPAQLLTGNHLACMFEEQRQNLERLPLQAQSNAVLTQLPVLQIGLINAEANQAVCHLGLHMSTIGKRRV